ncbi:uncharacterized protein LOC112545935 [Pelodiscus sinensis]|uniref:uncharacterized protein LOC112545935 n=1 Tax=Pelodiscus sinensis TaxID=13735 RepID=UPI003F6B512D
MASKGEAKVTPQEYLEHKYVKTRQAAVKANYAAARSEEELVKWWNDQKVKKADKAVIILLDILAMKEKEIEALKSENEALRDKALSRSDKPPSTRSSCEAGRQDPKAGESKLQGQGPTPRSEEGELPISTCQPTAPPVAYPWGDLAVRDKGDGLEPPPYTSPYGPAPQGPDPGTARADGGWPQGPVAPDDHVQHVALIQTQLRRLRNINEEGEPAWGFRMETPQTYRPFTPQEKQALLSFLPELQRDNKNMEFWDKLDGLTELHGLRKKDVHILAKCKCPRDMWDNLANRWKSGRWAEEHDPRPAGAAPDLEPSPNPDSGSVAEFRAALSTVLGAQATNWGALQSVTQQKGESAMSYAEKKWNAFRSYSGLDNITSRDHDVFLQILKEGLSADHQAVLALGLSVGDSFSAVMKWATDLENRKKKAAATLASEEAVAVHAVGTATCYTCDKPGHLARDCKDRMKTKMCSNCKRNGHRGREGQWPSKLNKTNKPNPQEQEQTKQIQELLKLLAGK